MEVVDNPADLTELSEGDESPPLMVEELSRTDIVRYAGGAGDFNRLHHDEPHATTAGFPSVIAHGMLVAGVGATLIEDWLGVNRVDEFGTRFVETVFPGDSLTARSKVTDVASDGARVEAHLVVRNQDEVKVLTGWVVASESR